MSRSHVIDPTNFKSTSYLTSCHSMFELCRDKKMFPRRTMTEKASPNFLFKAADLNAEGVLLLQQSKYSSAVMSFERGLEAILTKICSDITARKMSNSNFIDVLPDSTSSHGFADFANEARLLRSAPVLTNVGGGHDDVLVLFTRALYVPRDVIVSVDYSPPSRDLLMTSVILFNIGLAHQIYGLENCESGELRNALTYYSNAYSILLKEQTFCIQSNKRSSLHLAFLAVLNNIGHIHAYFRNFCSAGMCQDEIMTILTNSISVNVLQEFLVDEEFKTFLLNISFFRGAEFSAAPAA